MYSLKLLVDSKLLLKIKDIDNLKKLLEDRIS